MSLPTTTEPSAGVAKPKITLPLPLLATLISPVTPKSSSNEKVSLPPSDAGVVGSNQVVTLPCNLPVADLAGMPVCNSPESIGKAQEPEIPAAQALDVVVPSVALTPNPESDRESIITVVRTRKKRLGKTFDRRPDGTVRKKSVVKMGLCAAVMHYVPTLESFAALLKEVSEDPNAAIINSSFDGFKIGEKFSIGSARAIERYTGFPRGDRARQKGVHVIQRGDKIYNLTGRFKENVRPSKWQLLDRDVDSHTPEQFAKMSPQAWMQAFCSLIPGVSGLHYCQAQSTSARVLQEGVPVGAVAVMAIFGLRSTIPLTLSAFAPQ